MGTTLIASIVSVAFGGQDATVVTNVPAAAAATVVPEPALPQVTVPQPARVDIPSATNIPSGPVLPVTHPQPVLPPTAQDLLSKTMQSSPAGPANKLSAIAAPPPPAAVTNAATGGAISWVTNSPADPTDIWRTNSPVMDGVKYHW